MRVVKIEERLGISALLS